MRLIWILLFGVGLSSQAATPDSMAIAAEYYFSRQDYPQALTLWSEVLKRKPDSVPALERVAELKLIFQGRAASRDTLVGFLDAQGASLPSDARVRLWEKLSALQSTFLTDEGQSVYLRALPKVHHGDCAGAMPYLMQAVTLEPGNVKVLYEKARCEKALGLYDRFYESLRAAHESNPYDPEIRESLIETYLYYGEVAKAVALARRLIEPPVSVRDRTGYAIALSEGGAEAEALPILQGMVEQEKLNTVPPIVLFTLGQIFANHPDGVAEAVSFLERFLAAAARPENNLIDGWDPYHCQDKLETARKLLATLKTKTASINGGA